MSTVIDLSVFKPNKRINRDPKGKPDKKDQERVSQKVAQQVPYFGDTIAQIVSQNYVDSPEAKKEKATQDYIGAVESQKITDLSNYLMPEPERPEIDTDHVNNQRKQARAGAILQLIDSLGGAVQLQTGQDEAIHAPVDFSGLGLDAVNEMYRVNDQHKLDLDRYREQKLRTEQANMQMKAQIDQQNKAIDAEIKLFELENLIDKQEADRILQDSKSKTIAEAGLRAFSQGAFDIGQAYLKEAGVSPEGIDKLIEEYKTRANARTGSGKDDDEIKLTRHEIMMRRRAEQLQSDMAELDPRTDRVEYEKRKEELDFIRNQLKEKFYADPAEWDPNYKDKQRNDFTKMAPSIIKGIEMNTSMSDEEKRKTIQEWGSVAKEYGGEQDSASFVQAYDWLKQGGEQQVAEQTSQTSEKIFKENTMGEFLQTYGIAKSVDDVIANVNDYGLTMVEEKFEPDEAFLRADKIAVYLKENNVPEDVATEIVWDLITDWANKTEYEIPEEVKQEFARGSSGGGSDSGSGKGGNEPVVAKSSLETAFPIMSETVKKAKRNQRENRRNMDKTLSESTYVGKGLYVRNENLEEYKKLIRGNPEEQARAREMAFNLADAN